MDAWTQTDIDEANRLATIPAPDEREARYNEFQALDRDGRAFQVGKNNGRCGVIQHEDHYAVAKLWVVPQSLENSKIYTAHALYITCCQDCPVPRETIENYYRAFVLQEGFTPTISHDFELGVPKKICSETVTDNLNKIRAPARESFRKASDYLRKILRPEPQDMSSYIELSRSTVTLQCTAILHPDGHSSGGSHWDYERAISVSTKYFNNLKATRELELSSPVREAFERSVEVLVHFSYYIAERLLSSEFHPKMASQKINEQEIEVFQYVKRKSADQIRRPRSAYEWAREMRNGAVLVIRLLLRVANARGLSHVNLIFISMGHLKISQMREIGKCSEESRAGLEIDALEFVGSDLPDIERQIRLPEFPLNLISTMLASADNVHEKEEWATSYRFASFQILTDSYNNTGEE